jgi:hypothetical protein
MEGSVVHFAFDSYNAASKLASMQANKPTGEQAYRLACEQRPKHLNRKVVKLKKETVIFAVY